MIKNELPDEHILHLEINRKRAVTLVCSNASLRELIVGYLCNEGVIASVKDLISLDIQPDGSFASAIVQTSSLPSDEVRGSGLGGMLLCTETLIPFIPLQRHFSADYICRCAEAMNAQARMYAATGGIHCSALFDGERMITLFEDIGRHNTLDKITGHCILRDIDTKDTLLVTTGRISSDMVRKAGYIGVSALASYSTATKRALDFAVGANMTVVTYTKRLPFVVLSGEERIV